MKKIWKIIMQGGVLITAILLLSGCEKVSISENTEAVESELSSEESSGAEEKEESLPTEASDISESFGEKGLFPMKEGQSYTFDLNGDGIPETIRYNIRSGDFNTLEGIYVNDILVYNDENIFGSINVYLTDLNGEDGHLDLYIYSKIESDTTQTASFFSYKDNTFQLLGNLSDSEVINGYGTYYRGDLNEVREDGTIVFVMDTPVYANMFGCYYVEVSFRLEDGTIKEIPSDYYLFKPVEYHDWRGYVVNTAFTAAAEPGGSEEAFTSSVGEVMSFDGFCIYKGQFYGKITNSEGVSGWLVDKEGSPYEGEEAYFVEVPAWG